MPKFIGNTYPSHATRLADNASPRDMVRLSYAQMCMLPAPQVYYSLDKTDRGSRGTRAKRWYRWFALPSVVLLAAGCTPAMRARVAHQQAMLWEEDRPTCYVPDKRRNRWVTR